VNTTGAGGCFTSLQAAIDNATTVNGDTITVAANTGAAPAYDERVVVSKNVTIIGAGATSILDGGQQGGIGTTLTVNTGITTSVSGLVIRNGSASNVANAGTLTLTNDTITGASNGLAGQGGGINNTGVLFLVASTISNNTASFEGGAMINNGTMTLTNSTISGNQVTGMGGTSSGGVIDQGAGATVINSTISNNQSTGYFATGTAAVMANTIIAGNGPSTSADVAGNFSSGGYNLIGKADGVTTFTGTGDQTGTIAAPIDPKLGPLQSNAPGVTPTQALLTGSPALDKIPSVGGCNGANVTTDQRGVTRPQPAGGLCDIGAYEAQASVPAPTITAVSPSSGGTAGGNHVTLTGTGFQSGATVKVGANAATSVTVVNSTTITVTAPAGSAGTVSVTVTNPDSGTFTLPNAYTYGVVKTPPQPRAGGGTGGGSPPSLPGGRSSPASGGSPNPIPVPRG
ncbi:MAG: choice-of-anchor Q domain-containing protein, partial [Thermomicrobiales bacterium]